MRIGPVPPLEDHRLEAFLADLRSQVVKLGGDPVIVDEEDEGTEEPSGPDIGETLETNVELVDEGSGTEDAWTTLASGAPAGSTHVLLVLNLSGDGFMSWRQDDGEAEITVQSGSDTRYSVPFKVPLTAGGDFDYYANSGLVTWSIDRYGSVVEE